MPLPPRLLRRLLPPVLSAVLAVAVAVPATWYLASGSGSGTDAEPAALDGPADPGELRAELLAQLPGGEVDGAVVLEVSSILERAVAFPPGRYRLHLVCGLLRRQGDETEELSFVVDAVARSWQLGLPCPSTPQTLDEELDFTGLPAGAVSGRAEFLDQRPPSFLLLVRLVPVAGA